MTVEYCVYFFTFQTAFEFFHTQKPWPRNAQPIYWNLPFDSPAAAIRYTDALWQCEGVLRKLLKDDCG